MSGETEKRVYRANPAMFRDAPLRFILYLILIPVFGLGLVLMLVWYVSRKSVRLEINERSVSLMTGILSRCFVEIPLEDVAGIKVYQSWFQRLMGVGKISIASKGRDGYQIEVSALSCPFVAQRFLDRYKERHAKP